MKIFGKVGHILAVFLALVISNQVYATTYSLNGLTWGYSTDGGTTISTIDSLSFSGYSIVELEDTDSSGTLSEGDSFTDYSYLAADDYDIYSTSTLKGSLGEVATTSDTSYTTASFNGTSNSTTASTMQWYSSTDDSLILSVDVYSGSSKLSLTGTDLDIGQVSVTLVIDSSSTIAEDYFYVYLDGEWIDIADLVSDGETTLYLSVLTDSGVPNADSIVDEYADHLEEYSGMDVNDYLTDYAGSTVVDLSQAQQDDGSYIYVTSNDGAADLMVRTPEPGMLSLMGLAFIGLAGFQRRRNKKQMEL